jgi:ArsR family transcriptional regulator, arsenate/arsenite/antimonite-responsive transcriptional repressor
MLGPAHPSGTEAQQPASDAGGAGSISIFLYIDKGRCMAHLASMGKRLAIAEASEHATVCCPPAAKLRAKDVAAFATLFKALGDETRLSILAFLLAKQDALCVCHIEGYVKELSQPTISHHLRLLREAGLVTAERKGTWVYYSVNKAARDRLAEFAALLGG